MTRSFVFIGVSPPGHAVYHFYQPVYAPLFSFKVSLRLFTPLTKSRSSTDSEVCHALHPCTCDLFTHFPCQKYRTKDPWQTLFGQIQIPKKRILQYHLGKMLTHPSFARIFPLTQSGWFTVAQGTRLGRASCTNS
jgi:hypothetical protein